MAGRLVWMADGFTYSADRPRKRIDYIWLTPDLSPTDFTIIASTASDHLGLAVTVRAR